MLAILAAEHEGWVGWRSFLPAAAPNAVACSVFLIESLG
jgi:hypothetical protein